jgi:SAM-dependent methyltransferase
MVILFTITIFFGAALLFLVQPMFTRMVLPLLGGSPAVWNTSLVFYQAALLAGYAYAHLTTRWLGVRKQVMLHLLVLLVPLFLLPIAIPRGWLPSTQGSPIPWLLVVLAVSAGLPFFALSATSPLLQRWFAASGNRSATDPYFLYAASNLGSLLALASYPIIVEPHWGLVQQSRWWSVGYLALLALTAICGLWVRRHVSVDGSIAATTIEPPAAPLSFRRRLRWLLLAFVPCSLMLSATTYMTNEVAPIPLLWVIPLGTYLLTFVLVFARRRLVSHKWMVRALPLFVLMVLWTTVGLLLGQSMEPLDWFITLHLAALFVVAMVCHGELANDRPPSSQLTEFYLWLSVGGVLGGIFNALVAPWLFTTVLEYPITLILACALMPRRAPASPAGRGYIRDMAWAVALGLFTVGLILVLNRRQFETRWLGSTLAFAMPAVLCLAFSRRPLRFALGAAAILIVTMFPSWTRNRPVYRARSFFGIHQVIIDGEYHSLKHGSTVHGVQSTDPARRREPLSYYSRSGPLGELLDAVPTTLKQHVGVVGLGAGTVACYGERGQQWTFYEIDPAVERIARDPRYFTFLADCPADVNVVLGDARLSLQRAPDGQFGVLILDAYNSDSLPMHLITREALALYLQKLAPDGVLAFHISTRHLDLKSVLANLALDAHLYALHMNDFTGNSGLAQGRFSSRWLVMTRTPASVAPLLATGYWQPPRPRETVGIWTDDHASLFRVWSWF